MLSKIFSNGILSYIYNFVNKKVLKKNPEIFWVQKKGMKTVKDCTIVFYDKIIPRNKNLVKNIKITISSENARIPL